MSSENNSSEQIVSSGVVDRLISELASFIARFISKPL
jgi:hypothetical protein